MLHMNMDDQHAGMQFDDVRAFVAVAEARSRLRARLRVRRVPGLDFPLTIWSVRREGASGQRFQNPCDGMRNARLKREDAFSHAMIMVSSAIVSSS